MNISSRSWSHWRQQFDDTSLGDVGAALEAELAKCGVQGLAGKSVAITAGSRGIRDIRTILRHVVSWVKAQGGTPFVIPAMGSHGGGTATGQEAVLASYGLTEANLGCPIRASMEVVALPQRASPVPVYSDAIAYAADATIVVNRIKPHTDFHGRYESGLMKMIAIGLGKHAQALALHRHGITGIRDYMPLVAHDVLDQGKVVLGVGIVENAYDHTCAIAAIPAAAIPDREPELLGLARSRMPALPLAALDLLLVDQMGKDISGVGMDTNIIGRMRIAGEAEPSTPAIRAIVCHRLSEATHGNACGMGLADVVPQAFADAIDQAVTRTNVATSGFFQRGALPLVADNDRHAWELGLQAAWADAETVRALRIRDTLHVADFFASPALDSELLAAGCERVASGCLLHHDEGRLLPWPDQT